jgi:uncharacterized protein
MRFKKFILDPNIWISYILNKEEIVLANYVIRNKISIFVCEELIIEIKRVLLYPKFKKANINIRRVVNFIKEIAILV